MCQAIKNNQNKNDWRISGVVCPSKHPTKVDLGWLTWVEWNGLIYVIAVENENSDDDGNDGSSDNNNDDKKERPKRKIWKINTSIAVSGEQEREIWIWHHKNNLNKKCFNF